MSKFCTACKVEKSRVEFYARRDGSIMSACKSCVLAKRKAHYNANREHVRAYNRRACAKFRAANVEAERERIRVATAEARKAGRKPNWNKVRPDLHCAKEARRRAQKLHATPMWANQLAISGFYAIAQRVTRCTGIAHDVDHFVPLQGKEVCGLHVESNLRVIPSPLNVAKSNKLLVA